MAKPYGIPLFAVSTENKNED